MTTGKTHEMTLLEKIDRELLKQHRLIPCSDNTSFLLRKDGGEDRIERIIFRGEVLMENDVEENGPLRVAFSSDGKNLAIARPIIDEYGDPYFAITVNGRVRFRTESGLKVDQLAWLLNDGVLIWSGRFEDANGQCDERGVRFFLDGRDVTGKFAFSRSHRGVTTVEEGRRYYRRDDGIIIDKGPACCMSVTACHCEAVGGRRWYVVEHRDDAAYQQCLDDGSFSVIFNGLTGEPFDAFGKNGWAYNDARTRVGYVGVRYGSLARRVGRSVHGSLRKSALERKRPWWMFPAAILFNPYMGIGAAWIASTQRSYPVNHDKVWKKGYHQAYDHFFTPADELVVTAQQGRAMMVVIDEEESPGFDQVLNVRHIRDEGCVCYLALKGGSVYRVTVADQ